jgi:PKD repeat protein
MTKKFTFRNKMLGLTLLFIGLFGNLASYGQTYCIPYSYYGCDYTGTIRYGVIERMQLRDISGNFLFNKSPDACNAGIRSSVNATDAGWSLVTSKPAFTLSSGSKYTMGLSVSMTNGATVYNYSINIYVWIDLNRDGNFTANEYMSTGWTLPTTNNTAFGVGGNIQNNTFTLPCGVTPGTSRMRIISSYSYVLSSSQACTMGTLGSPVHYYGEQEDYTITLANPTSLAAGFYMPSTAYVGTVVKMSNTNQTGYISHDWDIDDNNTIEYKTTNASHIFTTTGTRCVRLKSANCLGRDSVLKCINIITPTARPVVDFAVSANEIERFGTANFLDLSTNGPTYWSWYIYDKTDSANTRMDVDNNNPGLLVGADPYKNQNPAIFFAKPGTFSVCMQSSNSQGPSSLVCKKDYLRVTAPKDNPLGAGTVQPIYEQSGRIIDNGGVTANYSNNRVDYATIIPCGAETITLTFSQFKVATGDILKVYDGQNAAGKPLHPGVGFTAGTPPTTPLVATSGAMYLYFTTNGTGVDSGFIANWVTVRGPSKLPIADFVIPDTLYNPVPYTYVNTSINVLGNTAYVWSLDQGIGEVGYTKDLYDYAIYTDNTYEMTLETTTCLGYDKISKNIVVVTPHTKTGLDFIATNRRPNTGEIVTLSARDIDPKKALKADNLKWSFFPNTVSYVGGTNSSSRDPKVTFNSKGKYTVSLRGYNSLDQTATDNTIIKSDFVIVVEHCTPQLSISSSTDVAINNVTLKDKQGKKLIDNSSFNNLLGYDDYTLTNLEPASITFGATYDLQISRTTNVNPMTRKVWMDWNIDGDFDDAGELIATENTANTLIYSTSFKVPSILTSFEGRTKMRIGTSYANDPNMPCGANSGITNANRLGEFEDYSIMLVNDFTPPVLTLNNADTLYIEVGSTYTEYGATAIDPTEGNISSSVIANTDVDVDFTGIYYTTYNVKDAGGNAAVPVTRVIYVVLDRNKPVITLNGSDTVRVEVYGTYTEDGATSMDNKDGNISNGIQIDGTVNTDKLGTYIITYSSNDQTGNKATKKRVVIVKDSQKPIINNSDADANREVKVQILSVFIDRTKVTDNYDNPASLVITNGPGTPDGVDTRFKGTYTLVYNSTDVSGNKADTKTYKYIVDDYTGPTIVLNTLDTIIHPVNKTYYSVSASVYDNYYDNTQLSITKTSNVIFYKLGLYYDEYKATDGSGNVTIRRRYVRVIDDQAPVLNGLPMNVGLWSNIDATQGLTITDNYDAPATLKPRIKVLFTNLNTYVEGVYAVTFEVSDLSGNVSLPFNRIINVGRNFEQINGVNTLGLDKTINVYPNPSNGLINVDYNFATPETMLINVYNSTGLLVASINNVHGESGIQTIDLSQEANGLYYVRMLVSGKQITRTISLNK